MIDQITIMIGYLNFSRFSYPEILRSALKNRFLDLSKKNLLLKNLQKNHNSFIYNDLMTATIQLMANFS